MQTGLEFWRALETLAAHLEKMPGTTDDRHREIIRAYSDARSLASDANLDQLQSLANELATIERLIGGNGQWDV